MVYGNLDGAHVFHLLEIARSQPHASRRMPPRMRDKESREGGRTGQDGRNPAASAAVPRSRPGCSAPAGPATGRPAPHGRPPSAGDRIPAPHQVGKGPAAWPCSPEIGSAQVQSPGTTAHNVCRLQLEKKYNHQIAEPSYKKTTITKQQYNTQIKMR